MRKVIAALAALGLGLAMVGPSVGTASGVPPDGPSVTAGPETAADHELPNPREEKRRALKEKALTAVLSGQALPERRNGSTVVKVGETAGASAETATPGSGASEEPQDQYVELSNERTDKVFTLLVEFGNVRHPQYPDQDTDPDTPGPSRFDGPLHNQIPQPNRAVDNSTIWEPDFSQQYFQNLYFGTGEGTESLKTYYEKQSSGRYSVDGEATAWVTVNYNEARYGRSNGFPCDDSVCDNTWQLVKDGMNRWVANLRMGGWTTAQVQAELAKYDVYDRYDFDGDGNFNEPDHYIDHLQIVHAGGDQADGDPFQGEDAIWSHRWYAFVSDDGVTGPPDNRAGGTSIGQTGFWAGDYTVQPENGGLSTIAHEYGHDINLPDHYDTAGGQNGVEWWTLMAQSRLSGAGEPIGSRAGDLSAWDKLQQGWLDYEVVGHGQDRTLDLGPHEYNSAKAQAAVVVLPEKTVTNELGAPFAGDKQWWSTGGDNLETSLSTSFDLTGATTAQLTAKARFDIEADFDYLYAQASFDGGATWNFLDGTVGGEPFAEDGSGNPAITGSSEGEWLDLVVPMDAAVGENVTFRFLYRTDGGVAPDGFFADEIVITVDGAPVAETGGEDGDAEEWTADGFVTTTGTETGDFAHYYVASNRSHVSYDQYLATGPYNFGFAPERPDFVEHFSYQEGLLISYWDTSQADNNTSEHPGQGLILPIDSHPRAIFNLTGVPWRSRIQVYDAPFSLQKADSFTLHLNGNPSYIRGQDAQPVFDDSRTYADPALPNAGVDVPDTNTRVRVLSQDGTSMRIRVLPG